MAAPNTSTTLNRSMYSQMRDPLDCIDVCVYDGSKHIARHAALMELPEDDDDGWEKRFLADICLGIPPAEMTIRDLLEDQYPWALEDGHQLVAAIWTTTEDDTPPDAAFIIRYVQGRRHFTIVSEL